MVTFQQNPFDIMIRCDSTLTQQLLEYVKIPSYAFVYKNRTKYRGGGVEVYSKEKFNFRVREDLDKLDETIEQLQCGYSLKEKNINNHR